MNTPNGMYRIRITYANGHATLARGEYATLKAAEADKKVMEVLAASRAEHQQGYVAPHFKII